MPRLRKCSYIGCRCTSKRDKDVIFFQFPINERRDAWISATKLFHIRIEDKNFLRFICSHHFNPKYLLKSPNRCILSKTAVPVPYGEDSDNSENENSNNVGNQDILNRPKNTALARNIRTWSSNTTENWRIKVEPEDGEQGDAIKNNAGKSYSEMEVEIFGFERVAMKEEPTEERVETTENLKEEELGTSCIDILEHPVKLEMEEEETDTLICGLPAPDTEFSDQEQPHKIEHNVGTARGPSDVTWKKKCEHCPKLFYNYTKLYAHTKGMHGEKIHACNECGRRFTWKSKLKSHLATHSKRTLFECPQCPKKYVHPMGLRYHVDSIHKGIRFACDLCSKTFTLKSTLLNHKSIKHGAIKITKTFQCDVCQKILNYKSSLLNHMKIFHLNLYSCDICQKKLSSNLSLCKHKIRVHNNTQYKCIPCSYLFVNKYMFDSHNNNFHNRIVDAKYSREKCRRTYSKRDSLANQMKYNTHCKASQKLESS